MPAATWPAAVSIGAVASIAMIGVLFHPWLVLGVVIDLALLWAVLLADWAPDGLTP